jgi:hypothetical protein
MRSSYWILVLSDDENVKTAGDVEYGDWVIEEDDVSWLLRWQKLLGHWSK